MPKYTPLSDDLYEYLVRRGDNHDPVLAELTAETDALGGLAIMQVAPEQGTLLSILARVSGARSAIEVGTFTGYSAICIARGLPADGRLICCDINEEWAGVARRYFDKAGVSGKIDLRIAPALETVAALPAEASFDLAFVDADKVSYPKYYETLLPRMSPNGLMVFDNVLWLGEIINPADTSEEGRAIRELNDAIMEDPRVEAVMIAVADGITIARKRTAAELGAP